MKPELWGPELWHVLHIITLSYPENPTELDKNNIKNFLTYLGPVLPCDKCKVHYNKNLLANPLTDEILSSKTKLIKWLIDIHNEVNKQTGKKIMSYEDALKCILYKCENKNSDYGTIIIIFVIMIFIIVGLLVCMRS